MIRSLFLALLASITISLPAAGDDTLDLSGYSGKVVVLDFWASWCVPCRRSFPWLNEIQARYGADGLVVVGVNVDEDRAAADAFLLEYPPEFEIFYDTDGVLAGQYNLPGMPSSFVIGRDGELVASHLGFKAKKQDEYEAAIVAALAGVTQE